VCLLLFFWGGAGLVGFGAWALVALGGLGLLVGFGAMGAWALDKKKLVEAQRLLGNGSAGAPLGPRLDRLAMNEQRDKAM
jgi:hypothetical protein